VFLAGEPFQDDDAGVVLELVDLVSDASAHEAPHGFGGRVAHGCGGGGEVGKASFAEVLSPCIRRAQVSPSGMIAAAATRGRGGHPIPCHPGEQFTWHPGDWCASSTPGSGIAHRW
jgi:hypothetical protein